MWWATISTTKTLSLFSAQRCLYTMNSMNFIFKSMHKWGIDPWFREALFAYEDITECWFLPNSRYWEGDMGLGPPNQSIKNMFSISNLKILKWWFFGQSFISGCLVKSADLAKSASGDWRSTNFNFPLRVSFAQVGFSGSIFPHVPRGNSLRVKEVLSSASASRAVGSKVVR